MEEASVRADLDGGGGGVGRQPDFEVGRRDMATFLRLLPKAEKYRSDRYEACSVPPLILHVKGKGARRTETRDFTRD